MVKGLPRRPISGGTRNGLRPERYDYWRVGYGERETYGLSFWLDRAGEFHGKPNHVAGHHFWTHTTQLFYHLGGEAVLEYSSGRSSQVGRGNIIIVPAYAPFHYRGRQPIKYHWLSIEGSWPPIFGNELRTRHLSLAPDPEIEAKLIEIREVLILQKQGYPIKAVGIFYEMVARIEEISRKLTTSHSTYPESVRNAIIYLTENYASPFSAADTAAAVNLSKSHLRALFEKWLGESPKQFHTRHRIEQAQRLLKEQNLAISEVAHQVGFNDIRHFSRVFKRMTGLAPSQYVKGQNPL